MSIPKEPRQLMINIMYLVLTALLALNVSAEIFNAFKVVDDGLNKSNTVLDSENSAKPDQIQKLSKKKEAELAKYAEMAPKVRALSQEFSDYIDGIVNKLIDDAGDRNGSVGDGDYYDIKGRKELKGIKNKDVTTQMLVDEGKGEEIKAKILELRSKFLEYVDEADRAAFESKLALNIDEESWKATKDKKSWADFNFRQMPLGATMPIFTKFKNDAKSTENAILDYYLDKVGGTDIVFDEFQVVAAPKKSYLTRGETYEANIFLSAASKNVENLSIRVNGAAVPVQNGVAKFTAPANAPGVKTYNATISFTNPVTKEVTTRTQEFEYEVGERSASVSLDKMNVFYVGVDNPITVAAAGISSNDLKVSAENVTLTPNGSAKYIVNAKVPGTAKIRLSANGINSIEYNYKVKPIPDPIPRIGGIKESEMGNGTFKGQDRMVAVLENFDFDARCDIAGFRIVRVSRGMDPQIETNTGGAFTPATVGVVNQAKPGDRYFFENIRCKCPGDAATRKLPELVVNIK